MSSAIAHPVRLAPHPSTPSDAIESLAVRVTVSEQGVLTLRYSLHADMSRIRIVSEGEVVAGRADGLWKHTCFEAFIQTCDSSSYYELNFSPAKQWAAYCFDAYREGMKAAQLAAPPEISIRKASHHLELDATLSLSSAAAGAAPRPRIALTAVVEEENGRLCYWSARHPPGKPDFHHPDGFAFEL